MSGVIMSRDVSILLFSVALIALWLLALTLAVGRMRRQFDREVLSLDTDLTSAEKTITKMRERLDVLSRIAEAQRRPPVPPPPVRPPAAPPSTNPISVGRHARHG